MLSKLTFQSVINFGSWVVLIIFIILGLYTLSSNTNLFGSYHSYVVLSGSMEPSIKIGDIIIVGQNDQYRPHDVITFKYENHLVTHRVVEIVTKPDGFFYLTKGDANRSEDDGQVNQVDVLGKVVFIIPKIGKLVAFSQSPLGLVLLIGIPALGLLVDTLAKKADA